MTDDRWTAFLDSRMYGKQGWRWFGNPAHHILGARCAFHLATLVCGGTYLVSTVGNLDRVEDDIGHNRKYETVVFPANGVDEHGDPITTDWRELDFEPYNKSHLAEQGHYRMCWKWEGGSADI